MNKKFGYAFIFLGMVLLIQCSIKAPEINITGEKTALESQVLGAFQQIESDSWVIASTRAFGSGGAEALSAQKQKVLDAVQNRKFNKDDIDEFKRDKVIGENNKGFLEILPTDRYEHDLQYQKLVDQIVAEENRDRKIIYERILATNPSLADADEEKLYEIFTKLNVDNSEPGTLYQLPDGTWVEKK